MDCSSAHAGVGQGSGPQQPDHLHQSHKESHYSRGLSLHSSESTGQHNESGDTKMVMKFRDYRNNSNLVSFLPRSDMATSRSSSKENYAKHPLLGAYAYVEGQS